MAQSVVSTLASPAKIALGDSADSAAKVLVQVIPRDALSLIWARGAVFRIIPCPLIFLFLNQARECYNADMVASVRLE